MLAREITIKEIELGIGKERSSTRLSPIFKTIDLYIPIKNGKLYTPKIPIDPFEGSPLLLMPLIYIPHDESILFGTPSINERLSKQDLQPTRIIADPGKGTGSPILAAAIDAKDDDILILAACDQFHSPAVTKAITTILDRIEQRNFSSGTVLTTGTRNPAFSYFKIKDDKAIEFMLKGTIPKDDMIAETMIVCVTVAYLKNQIAKMKEVSIAKLKELYPYTGDELAKIQQNLKVIADLMENCSTAEEFLAKCPFCDFSKVIHRLLIPEMTYATVEYIKEWNDLGDWLKVYHSGIFPKDKNNNLIFSKEKLISYTSCENSVIANFANSKIIVNGLKNRIFAVGPRGVIDLPLDMDPNEYKKEVVKIQM